MTVLDHARTPYADALGAYVDRGMTSICTPGHNGYAQPKFAEAFGARILAMDIQPLVEGIDRGAGSPLEQAQALAADAWGARRTWFLTNGASQGNVTALLALRGLGDTIVAQRSVHSSVIDGLALSGMEATFVRPTIDHELGIANGVTPAALEAGLRATPKAVAAYVVTPSYFGAVSDVAALAEVAHRHGAALVVDEAWGPHLGFDPGLPINALRAGADLVISSTHKLGGSLTQSAMLHLGEGPWADELEPLIDRAFRSLQSTSASAILMASLDIARYELVVNGPTGIPRSLQAAEGIRQGIAAGGRFADAGARIATFPDVFALDPLHVVINTRIGGVSGHEAKAELFSTHRIHLEIATDDVVVAIIGAGAVPDAAALCAALAELPDTGALTRPHIEIPEPGPRAISVRKAWFGRSEVVTAAEAVGRISADCVAAYPPGIPNLMPGERITEASVAFLQETAAAPFGHVRGAITADLSAFRVVVD